MLANIASLWPAAYTRQQLGEFDLSIAAISTLVLATSLVVLRQVVGGKQPLTKDGKPLPRPPTTLPVLHNTLDLLKNADRMHDYIAEETLRCNGKPWLLHAIGQPPMIMISSPEGFDDLERKLFDKFPKGAHLNEFMHDFFGDGMVNAEGELWAYQRKTAMNLFSSRALREHMSAIINNNTITLDTVFEKAASANKEIDVCNLLHQFTMEVFTEIGFGLKLGNIGSETAHPFEVAFDDAQHIVMGRMQLPAFWWKLMRLVNLGSEAHLKKCMKIVNSTIMDIVHQTIENARSKKDDEQDRKRKDVISLFLESGDSKGMLTPTLLRDIALTLIIAGRDTSAETMSYAINRLSQHPEVEHKIREEIRAKLGSKIDVNDHIGVEELQQLTYLEAVVKETLRLQPPISINPRCANEDVVLTDGTFVPKGVCAVITPYTTGRRPDVWGDDAEEFKPERWIDPNDPSKLISVTSFKFNTFLAGPRQCIGMNLAMLEIKTVLVKLLSKFHLEVTPGQNITYRHGITLPLKEGLRVQVRRV